MTFHDGIKLVYSPGLSIPVYSSRERDSFIPTDNFMGNTLHGIQALIRKVIRRGYDDREQRIVNCLDIQLLPRKNIPTHVDGLR